MKNCSLLITLVACCAFGVMPSPLNAQGLTAEQLDAIVKPSLAQCHLMSGKTVEPTSVIPIPSAREFPKARIARSLHGMWRGQVYGDNKEVPVDYFWIIDTRRNEGLMIAQRTGKESMADLKPVANAPKITYLMCAHKGYIPATDTAQIHEFVKVSDSIEDAPRILQKATGVKFKKARPRLSDLWQEIVASGYFKSMPAVAFAGALFKPILIETVTNDLGPAQVSLKWNGEYYGGGSTGLTFTPGVPIKVVEYTQFIGTTASSGNYLVSSPGNGKLWKVEAISGGNYDLAFDSVVVGPLR
jgi:hypothetical protein